MKGLKGHNETVLSHSETYKHPTECHVDHDLENFSLHEVIVRHQTI